ncbi:hypothetical protein H6G64_24320 [Calothrix sp. FACHB-156]|nr:hypothetical protein [Calothrix sp. FACHB-156]
MQLHHEGCPAYDLPKISSNTNALNLKDLLSGYRLSIFDDVLNKSPISPKSKVKTVKYTPPNY